MKKKKMMIAAAALVIGASALGTTVVAAQGTAHPKDGFGLRAEAGPPFPGAPWAGAMQPWWEGMKARIAEFLGVSETELDEAHEAGTPLHELVDELGVDPADFRQAMSDFRTEAVEEALAEGLIDEQQAEWLLAHAGGRGPRLGFHGPFGGPDGAQWDETIAGILDISLEELRAAREEGRTLADLAEELDVGLTDLQDALEDARAQALAEAVEAGRITAEQAERMQDHGPMGMGSGPRLGRGRFGGGCQSNR